MRSAFISRLVCGDGSGGGEWGGEWGWGWGWGWEWGLGGDGDGVEIAVGMFVAFFKILPDF